MIVMLEGIDGCGKTTQAHLLVEHYRRLGRPAQYFREPGSTPLGEQLRGILLHTDVQPVAQLLLFQAARVEFETAVRQWLGTSNEAVAVIDRGWPSTVAYQGAGNGIGTAQVLDVIRAVNAVHQPLPFSAVLVLAVAPAVCRRRLAPRELDRYESKGAVYFDRVSAAYASMPVFARALGLPEGTVRCLNGLDDLNVEAVHRLILSELQ